MILQEPHLKRRCDWLDKRSSHLQALVLLQDGNSRGEENCMPRISSSKLLSSTPTPFLYPCLDSNFASSASRIRHVIHQTEPQSRPSSIPFQLRHQSSAASAPAINDDTSPSNIDVNQYDHLTPAPPDYTTAPFTDSCTLTLEAGSGGHGCISFLREKYIENGPPNGGDGGPGGNIWIQAVRGETSLHKLARRGSIKATRGRNGQGGLQNGKRGEDIVVQVPIGTVVREVSRRDPVEEELAQGRRGKGKFFGQDAKEPALEDGEGGDQTTKWRRDKWLLYPGTLPRSFSSADFPPLPRPRRSHLTASQPPAPIRLDLDKPMTTPMLLAAGAMGGLSNSHFVTKSIPRPKFGTKGEEGMRIQLQLELKLLADVGLVGPPNAGKSTLLRALTKSRTRVGNWAFTTLSPNIGTVVLDDHLSRPHNFTDADAAPRTHFTIADIPGLIEDAHLDRGLGLGFLRHIERAAVLAFVVDLSAGDAVAALKALWREVGEYEKLREQELNEDSAQSAPSEEGVVGFKPFESSISPGFEPEKATDNLVLDPQGGRVLPPLNLQSGNISAKPWFVVATKADLPSTQDTFAELQAYLKRVQDGVEEHPSGKKNAWRRVVHGVPVSAINKEGVAGIPGLVLSLLDG